MQYILGAYSQLPYGSSVEEYETLVAKQLKPLLTMVYRNSNLKLLFRLSIAEFDYFEVNHPELNMLINDLCRKGQMEILSSSYYDVVLPMIPSHERSSQIEKTTTYIRKHFSKKPRGLWCYNQVFNPTMVPLLALTGLEYIIISPYNQLTNCIESTRPFYTDEMGKQALVIPLDDRFSKQTQELYKGNIELSKYLMDCAKLAKDTTNAISTVMLNLDQLMKTDGSVEVFSSLYENFGPNCTLPSIYTQETEVARTHYLPNGIYGRDYTLGKATSINQLIYDNPMLSRHYGVVNMLKDVIRDSKKSIEDRKSIENLLMKVSSSSLYFPNEYRTPQVRRCVNRHACELETILSKMANCPLPQEMDIDFDRVNDFLVQGKQHIAYISQKGAVLTRFIVTSSLFDIAFHSGDGLFADSFINEYTSKEIRLSAKPFEVTPLDKRRVDFFANAPSIMLGKSAINFTKRYKFRLSTVIVEIEIENLSYERIDNFTYESAINIALPQQCSVTCSDGPIHNGEWAVTQNMMISDKNCPFTITLALSEQLHIVRNDFEQKTSTWLGDKSFYEYTQLKIQKKLSLEPLEETRLTIGFRTEKRKEKHNDTFEQSAP